jgi:diadenylate cyclase
MRFVDVLQYVGLADVFDIVATSILIYYVLLLIRGTRAVQILTGILVLVGLLALANLLHLYLLGSILQVLVVGASVTLPIVFQPELRRALEQIGRGGLFRFGEDRADRQLPENRIVADVAHAAFGIAQNRAGALIVIEQQSGLKEFCETGTSLNAELSGDLVLAIFAQRSPLHDGATIVRENAIVAAGCLLPLAERRAAQRLGTRHRAALGLSEQTDAIVIVVSEESGAVSVAREGKLTRPIESEVALARLLLGVMRPPRGRTIDLVGHLRSRLFERRGRKESHADHPTQLRA